MEVVKIVYNIDNGAPFPVVKNAEGESVYPEFEYTTEPVPEGLYQPVYFDVDQQKWVGSTKEEFEKTIKRPIDKSEKDLLLSQLTIQVATQKSEVVTLQKTVGELALQLAQLKGASSV